MSTGDIQINIRGLEELIARSGIAKEAITRSLAGAIYRDCEHIMGRSKDEFVPVDTGALKSTGHVEEPEIDGEAIRVSMGYGGPSGVVTGDGQDYVGYALYVHEGTEHMEGRHYLERPTMEEAPGMPGRVGEGLKRDLEDAL